MAEEENIEVANARDSIAHGQVDTIAVGIDIGSTTVKAVVCDPETLEILWSDYKRHETRQPEMVLEFLIRIGKAFEGAKDVRCFVTTTNPSAPGCCVAWPWRP